MVLHYFAPKIRRFPGIPEHYTTSFTGGFAASYVFLHLLPGLAENRETLGQLLSEDYFMTPLKELDVYMVGLLGFLLFFGLDRIAERKTYPLPVSESFHFYLHLSAILLYNGIITYTMPVRVMVGPAFAVLFTVVMGLHFVIQDQALERHFPEDFKAKGRFLLILALLGGFILAAVNEPDNVFVVALLNSFLGGAVLMNVFRNELPTDRKSSFTWFTVGIALGAALLFWITWLEHPSNIRKAPIGAFLSLRTSSLFYFP